MNALGIDIGGTRIKAGVVSQYGQIVAQATAPSPSGLEDFRAAISAIFQQLPLEGVKGAGFGCKGIIHPETTRVEILPGTMKYLEGQRLADFLPSQMPVAGDNDARVAMAGEMMWGAAQGHANAIMLTLGTGVGGAIIANGQLLRGAAGVAGHLGHIVVNPDGPTCICGNHGCLETYFSATAVESVAAAAVRRGCATTLKPGATCRDVFQHAAANDEEAKRIVSDGIRALGAALSGMILMLDPEVIILGGQISEAGRTLLEPLRKEIRWRTRVMIPREISLVTPQVADPSGICGAAALVFTSL